MEARRRVLLVDDEPDILDTLQRLVEAVMPHVEVVTAASGEEALEKLDATRVDVLLSDYKMPGMDGLELLAAARARHPRVRRVLLTAYQAEEVREQARRSGAGAAVDVLLPKSGDPADFLQRLSSVLGPLGGTPGA